MAHEVNSPIGVILGYTKLPMKDRRPDDPDYEGLRTIETALYFPPSHRRRLRSARVVEIFPSPQAAERFTGAMVIDQDEQWLTGHRYLNMEDLADWETEHKEELPIDLHFAATACHYRSPSLCLFYPGSGNYEYQ